MRCGVIRISVYLAGRLAVAGVKQSKKHVLSGEAREVIIAVDADPRVTAPILELCRQKDIPVKTVPTMRELGSAAGIDVPSAVITIID